MKALKLIVLFSLTSVYGFSQSRINIFLNFNGTFYKNSTVEAPLNEFREKYRFEPSLEFITEFKFHSSQAIGLGVARNSIGYKINLQSNTNEFYKYEERLMAPLLSIPTYYKFKIADSKARNFDILLGLQYFINLNSGTFTGYSELNDTLIQQYEKDSLALEYKGANCFGPYIGINYRISNSINLRATFTSALKPLLILKAYYSSTPKQFPNGNIYYDDATRFNLGLSFNLSSIFRKRPSKI